MPTSWTVYNANVGSMRFCCQLRDSISTNTASAFLMMIKQKQILLSSVYQPVIITDQMLFNILNKDTVLRKMLCNEVNLNQMLKKVCRK